jgi:hypothetical protein
MEATKQLSATKLINLITLVISKARLADADATLCVMCME